MQGFVAVPFYILVLSLVLVPVSASGTEISQNISAEYADLQSFRSIDNASLALYAGQNALQAGRYEEALEEYTNATESDPSWVAAWYLKAYTLVKLNRTGEALVAVDRALSLDPSDRDSNNLKADILEQLGRGNEAAMYRKTPVSARAAPSVPVPATTPKKAPINPMTLGSGLLCMLFLARKFRTGTAVRYRGKTGLVKNEE